MSTRNLLLLIALALVGSSAMAQQAVNHDLGFTDTPILPGLPYHVHDPARPHPPVVNATPQFTPPPSDATVLFDGKDLERWVGRRSSITRAGAGDQPLRA